MEPSGTLAEQSHSSLLILAVGNPSRGDDALGPLFLERLAAMREQRGDWNDIELLTDFQLQIEHAVDLENRALALFVDASVSCPPPFQLSQLQPVRDISYISHALSPAAVLHAVRFSCVIPARKWFIVPRMCRVLSPVAREKLFLWSGFTANMARNGIGETRQR